MNMIKPMIKSLFSIYAWVTIIVSLIFSRIVGEATIPLYILNIVIIILFSLFYALYNSKNRKNLKNKHDFTDLIVSSWISLSLFIFSNWDSLAMLSTIIFVLVLFWKIEYSIFFTLACVYFSGVILFKLLLSNQYADYLSLQVVYLIIYWIIAIIIDGWLLRQVHSIIIPIERPKWWDWYVYELKNIAEYLSMILPFLCIGGILFTYSPYSIFLKFDERLITSLTFMMCALFPLQREFWKIAKSILFIIMGATFLFMFETYIEWIIWLALFGWVSWLFHKKYELLTQIFHRFTTLFTNVLSK